MSTAAVEMPAVQAIWAWLGSPAYPPPPPKRGRPEFGTDARCWLCGGDAGQSWPRDTWLTPTFTNHTLAVVPESDAICQACAYLGSGDTWRAYCAAHPEMNLKSVHPLSWRSYSHYFAPGVHQCPSRAQWRELLICPPEPPFAYVLAESGQKHIVFRARISTSRDVYWVRAEDDLLVIDREDMTNVLDLFEQLLALGFTRDEVRTGRYQQSRLLRAGVGYLPIEDRISVYRQHDPDLLRLAAHAARGPKREEKSPG